MDTAVALVQAYLNTNGYFTVVEYPVLEARHGEARCMTDLDILAFRFPGAGREVRNSGQRRTLGSASFELDPALEWPDEQPDMIVGEVKEGRGRFNPAARDPAVLGAALARFGCCDPAHVAEVARELLRHGRTVTPCGHRVRLVVFGSVADESESRHILFVPISHVIEFLQGHLREHWDVLRHAQIKDPALSLLAVLEKAASWRAQEPSKRAPEKQTSFSLDLRRAVRRLKATRDMDLAQPLEVTLVALKQCPPVRAVESVLRCVSFHGRRSARVARVRSRHSPGACRHRA